MLRQIVVSTALVFLAACGGGQPLYDAPVSASTHNAIPPGVPDTDPSDPEDTVPDTTPVEIPKVYTGSGNIIENDNGTVTVVDDGRTFQLGNTTAEMNDQPVWLDYPMAVRGYRGADVIAVGGYSGATMYSAIRGVVVPPPVTNATFEGVVSIATTMTFRNFDATISYDALAQTLTLAEPNVAMDATVSGNEFTGTMSYGSASAPVTGGFYGADEVAGAFDSTAFAGVVFGTRN